ncbi:DUF397 domain-containing protein [Actinophytocola oryzae]|uniref:Uncharacterized protein DUF397 n=1 Tax=Actinophytocola oryzae TaxID=502181 RepID=A0A4R7UVG6_9PSEU|nr:DUF397 domain-containing protein [Actinophytocola oryzae]TDV40034.1 uncharacterized protein DUF397 [Actinophytocola oryzae]
MTPQWRKSSFSSNGEACVEIAPALEQVLVRDSKCPDAGMIELPVPAWATFVRLTSHSA